MRSIGEYIKVFGPAILIASIGFVVAYQFVDPAPPRRISIATGSPSGAYFAYGGAYSEILKRNGIRLEVLPTAGSAENIRLLEAESGGVDVALIAGGFSTLAQSDEIISLGSLYYEPLWIFHQTNLTLARLPDLKGLRLAVGEEGSGTKVLALQLLELNGITEKNTRILSYGSQEAANMLLQKKLDAAIFVTTHRSPYIQPLIESRSLKLMGLERAKAYALQYHYLHVLEVPEGVLNFEANIPSRDTTLVAVTTQLAARSDLHPALITLLLQAAEETHSKGGGFEKEGQFPSPKYVDFDLSKEAVRFYNSGPPFLQRYLPFWVAVFLTRMMVMLVPLLALLYPLFKVMPLIYKWRMRSRIYRWYSELKAVDPEVQKDFVAERLEEYLAKLNEVENQVSNISIPPAYAEGLYDLRLHIELLRNKLRKAGNKE
ncbi:MAG: TAXI family TRAP transporter solute-binding subunit [Deltaproteobacteria bacterium]|nr:MAG: TAXI family TRAP transporter solute-binding subunit [Deltaproteobacteria bacterium]